ncbi:conserved hypothetical protein [Candidatus Desulfarcum epimagneticum]|uniref:Uncharacterized protein n=1 Tax=uncultured Desulfobacteraceae bacterium TaxID=218296 RepID=A0A484HCM1_9BACT|nr:conserved hypothetical protein [uncultured Desulfobacteraceae bacterium]
MISINVGRAFLKAYNTKNNTSYSSREFFEKIFFGLFFNHPKYMIWPTNSPFVQMEKGQKPHLLSPEERREKLNKLFVKAKTETPDSSFAIGFPASELKEFATTSGLVSDMEIPVDESDIYYSWIGSGLGIGVSGGVCIFFTEPEILLKTFEGWHVYRKFLNDETLKKLAPNKINSWNGQWLNYVYQKRHKKNFDFTALDNQNLFKHGKDGTIVIETIKWSKLFFNISRKFPDQTLMGYVYSLGQTNKTLGFFPFHFKQAQTIKHFYKILFGENNAIRDSSAYENLYGAHIKRACELGSIGLHALQPAGLKQYFKEGKKPNFKKLKVAPKKGEGHNEYRSRSENASLKDREKVVLFRTYKAWLVAMITKNKEDMVDYTRDVALALHAYKAKATKNVAKNLIEKELLVAKSRKKFIEALVEIVQDAGKEDLETYKELKNRVHLMTAEDFGYFVVLLRFDYAYEERNV